MILRGTGCDAVDTAPSRSEYEDYILGIAKCLLIRIQHIQQDVGTDYSRKFSTWVAIVIFEKIILFKIGLGTHYRIYSITLRSN